jgi:hypothetical protein
MRHRARQLAVTLTCALALAACGSQPSDQAASAGDSSGTSIPDDFPLTSGMGGPEDAIPTSRTGTGLRDLELCGTAPLRGLGVRDRLVADNSGGESADTRELVLLGSPEEAALVAQAFIDLARSCDTTSPAGQPGLDISTEVRPSGFGPVPAATLVQTYTFDGAPGEGHTIVHVVPVGAAVLVSSTYGQVPDDRLEEDVDATQTRLRATAAALGMFGSASTESPAPEPAEPPTRVGAARLMNQTYGEGSLASLDEQADGVTATTGKIVPAMCVFTKTGC